MEKNEEIVAVIVTFNRRELLLENIKMLMNQSYPVDKIIIIDNHGTDHTKEFLIEKKINFDKIQYIYLNENLGRRRRIL